MEKPILNKIYTWPLVIANHQYGNPEDFLEINNIFLAALVEESAHQIIMPSSMASVETKDYGNIDYKDGVPSILKKYIKFSDDEKLKSKIDNFMAPIINCEKQYRKNSNWALESSMLSWYLCILANAIKYESQADINIVSVKSIIERLKHIITDNESKCRLSIVAGIFNLYQDMSFPVVYVSNDSQQYLSDKINTILNHNTFKEISISKRNLGVLERQSDAIKNFPKLVHNFIREKELSKLLKEKVKKLSLAINTPIISSSIPISDIIFKDYNPVITSLDQFRGDISKKTRT